MARINIDDDLESREEFKKLRRLLGNDDDRALGMLARFWRLAQKYWVEDALVPMADIEFAGLEPIIESRWGIVRDGSVYAVESETRFAWLRQRTEAGKKGGRPKSPSAEDAPPPVQPDITDGNRTETGEEPGETGAAEIESGRNPLTLTLSPALSLSQERERGLQKPTTEQRIKPSGLSLTERDQLDQLLGVWIETLRFHKKSRGVVGGEDKTLLIQMRAHGFETVKLALIGARYEPAHDGFDPRKYVDLGRIFGKDKNGSPRLPKYVSWATGMSEGSESGPGVDIGAALAAVGGNA